MSFILDALKKSERERQRKAGPSIADVHISPARAPRRIWIIALIALLGVNLVLVVIMWWPSESATPPVVTRNVDIPEPEIAIVEPLPPPQSQPPDRDVRPLAEEVVRPMPGPFAPDPQSSAEPVRTAALDAAPLRAGTVNTGLSTLADLSLAGVLNLPPLRIDIHVFSEQAAERFVFVNMSKYREGERLSEGPVVSEIVHEGVVLQHQGQRFLLPRD